MDRRVAVTGIGIISPGGNDKHRFWETVKNGVSCISYITKFDAVNFPTRIASEVRNFNPVEYLGEKRSRRTGLFAQYALVAAMQAVDDSGLALDDERPSSVGVVLGTAAASVDVLEAQHNVFREEGLNRVSPFLSSTWVPNVATGEVSLEFNAKGPNTTISTACSSGLNAIGYGYDCIRTKKADIIIAGGIEAPITPLVFGAFGISKQLSTRNDFPEEASRPFDRDRDGMVLSEGAGIVILEDLGHALKRNARIYGEIVGYGTTGDAYSTITLDPTGQVAAEAIKMALRDAKCSGDDVNYVCAHASSSLVGDRKEVNSLKLAFRSHAYKVPVSSIKSMLGIPLGASGGFQMVASLMSMHDNIIPPTINYENPDPDCDLDFVPLQAREQKVDKILVNSFGLGGNNATVVLSKFASGRFAN